MSGWGDFCDVDSPLFLNLDDVYLYLLSNYSLNCILPILLCVSLYKESLKMDL